MLDKLAGIEKRFAEIEDELNQVGDDYKRAAALAKERAELEPIVQKAREYRQALQRLEEARLIMEEGDDEELRELAKAEIDGLIP
jgi:peptide chain release factor 1